MGHYTPCSPNAGQPAGPVPYLCPSLPSVPCEEAPQPPSWRGAWLQVQEAVVGAGAQARMPELAANAASVQLAASHYLTAEQQYAAAARRFSHGASPRLLLHLARTQYHANQVGGPCPAVLACHPPVCSPRACTRGDVTLLRSVDGAWRGVLHGRHRSRHHAAPECGTAPQVLLHLPLVRVWGPSADRRPGCL